MLSFWRVDGGSTVLLCFSCLVLFLCCADGMKQEARRPAFISKDSDGDRQRSRKAGGAIRRGMPCGASSKYRTTRPSSTYGSSKAGNGKEIRGVGWCC